MNFKEELLKQKEELKKGTILDTKINTESFFYFVKSRIARKVFENPKEDKIMVSFLPLNRENYEEMFHLNLDLDYLKELCNLDGIDFYIAYVDDNVTKWQTYFFEVNLKKEKVLTLTK